MSKWQCCVCGNDEPCILHMVNDKEGFRPVCCPVDNTSGIKSDWLPVDEPVTDCNQLPDWCKPGEWCYCKDDDGNDKYFKITRVDREFIYGDDWDIHHICCKPARLRPWKGSESLNKVVITGGDTFGVVIGCTWSTANVSGQWINCKKLLADDYKQPDGSPCGVQEHLENGEWVK